MRHHFLDYPDIFCPTLDRMNDDMHTWRKMWNPLEFLESRLYPPNFQIYLLNMTASVLPKNEQHAWLHLLHHDRSSWFRMNYGVC